MYIPCTIMDPDLWFPVGSTGPALMQQERAKALCASCNIREECLQDALARGDDNGVWGGHSAAERRAMLRIRPVIRTEGTYGGRSPLSLALASPVS